MISLAPRTWYLTPTGRDSQPCRTVPIGIRSHRGELGRRFPVCSCCCFCCCGWHASPSAWTIRAWRTRERLVLLRRRAVEEFSPAGRPGDHAPGPENGGREVVVISCEGSVEGWGGVAAKYVPKRDREVPSVERDRGFLTLTLTPFPLLPRKAYHWWSSTAHKLQASTKRDPQPPCSFSANIINDRVVPG